MVVLLNMVQSFMYSKSLIHHFRFTYDDAADPRRQSASSAPKHITSRLMQGGHARMLQMYTIPKARDHGLFFLASLMQPEPTESKVSIMGCHVHHVTSVCSIQIGLYLGFRPKALLAL